MVNTSTKFNRLSKETSPYLQQHAQNPVDWYPWGEEAFEKAKLESKPVFISIGYSSCHWCHVMERECFEDEEVAKVLNRAFVSIKVDREERPDVDHFYMQACQAMTGSGGWPLSAFATWERKPFFTGTYFPKLPTRGGIGFLGLLRRIEEMWQNDRSKLADAATGVSATIAEGFAESKQSALSPDTGRESAELILKYFDSEYGGFGGAPKFPSPHVLMFLMRAARSEPTDSPTWQAVSNTLEHMARGGIRDHIGGGFCRYSTDNKWLVPHFEKMAYDNALLLMAYTERYQKAADRLYGQVAREIAEYVLRDMTDTATGLFYTARDADSDGEEGRFYTFTPEEVRAALGEEAERFCEVFDINAGGHLGGRSVPNMIKKTNIDLFDSALDGMRKKMFDYREKRSHPFRDEKGLLTSCSLMVAALAKAGAVFEEESYRKAAARAAQFMLENMRVIEENRLFAVWKDGVAGKPATLDGYAYFIWALLELYQADFNETWLNEAEKLTRSALKLFDGENGGLYYTGSDISDLPKRGINATDGAVPSGQSVMAYNLIRLSHLTGDEELESRAGRLIGCLAEDAAKYPSGYCFLLAAADYLGDGGTDVAVSEGEGRAQLIKGINGFRPYLTLCLCSEKDKQEDRRVKPVDGKAAAYVCAGKVCYAPVTDPDELLRLL